MSTDTIGGFLHPGANVIDTLQPDHAHSLAARVRELEAALMIAIAHAERAKGNLTLDINPRCELTELVTDARRALRGGAA